jgi:hypothetical protein
MIVHIEIIGFLLIALALVHVVFPRYFKWSEELRPLSLINREMMWVHTFFIALNVLLMGLLCITSAEDLVGTVLGKRVCLGFAVFWGIRLVVQFFGYSSALWKGKGFETGVHIAFTLLWVYVSVIFGSIGLSA